MIEHRAAGLANAHRIHERRRPAARQPVSDERRALGRLLGHRREARQHVDRRASAIDAGQPSRQLVAYTAARAPSVRTGSPRARAGTDTASAATALTALSRYASQARRSRGVTADRRSPQPAHRAGRQSWRRRRRTAGPSRPSRQEMRPRRRARRRRAAPSGPDVPPAPSTMLPCSTAIAAVNAPPSSSRMNETSRSPHPRRSTCS